MGFQLALLPGTDADTAKVEVAFLCPSASHSSRTDAPGTQQTPPGPECGSVQECGHKYAECLCLSPTKMVAVLTFYKQPLFPNNPLKILKTFPAMSVTSRDTVGATGTPGEQS